nr:hypothetical protein [Planctomycetota bacterium]
MAIRVTCSCGWEALAKPEHAGKRITCRECDEVLRVPSPKRSRQRRPPQRRASRDEYDDYDSYDDYSDDSFDDYAPRRSAKRKKKRKKRELPGWILPSVLAIVLLGILGTAGFFVVNAVQNALHTEPPVFATGESRVSYTLNSEVLLKIESVSMKLASTLGYDLLQTTDSKTVTLQSIDTRILEGPNSGIHVRLAPDVASANVPGNSMTFTVGDAPADIRATMVALGKPVCMVPVEATGHGQVRMLQSGSLGEITSGNIHLTPIFLSPPFATNVDEWEVEVDWPITNGTIPGELTYEKTKTDGSLVTVSVSGTLRKDDDFAFAAGFTASDARYKVSGTQVYSTETNQWQSADLTMRLTATLRNAGRSGRVSGTINIDLSSQTLSTGTSSEGVPAGESGAPLSTSTSETAGPFYPEGNDWSIPIPAAKSPVSAGEYQSRPDQTTNDEADEALDTADALKARGQY